jgi:hypothetical protein
MSNSMRAQDYLRRYETVEGWQVGITSYQLGDFFYCTIDNVSPGANVARAQGATREEAEAQALAKARERLGRTRIHS